jgi:flavin-dependent dehydrogenase
MREKTSVGLVVPIERMDASRTEGETLEGYFLRRCSEIPYLNRLLESAAYCKGQLHALRPYAYRPKQLCGPGFFLVGDAAAFIDPILSEGCLLAMYSAYMAAWAIDRSLKDPSRAAVSQAFFTRQFAGRYELGHALMLTPYGASSKAADVARHSIGFDSSREQELMHVALTMAGRSENLLKLFGSRDTKKPAADKYRTLERLGF